MGGLLCHCFRRSAPESVRLWKSSGSRVAKKQFALWVGDAWTMVVAPTRPVCAPSCFPLIGAKMEDSYLQFLGLAVRAPRFLFGADWFGRWLGDSIGEYDSLVKFSDKSSMRIRCKSVF